MIFIVLFATVSMVSFITSIQKLRRNAETIKNSCAGKKEHQKSFRRAHP